MMTYLGTQTAKKIAGGSNAPVNPLDGRDFPEHPLYNGDPVVPAHGRRLVPHARLDRPPAGR